MMIHMVNKKILAFTLSENKILAFELLKKDSLVFLQKKKACLTKINPAPPKSEWSVFNHTFLLQSGLFVDIIHPLLYSKIRFTGVYIIFLFLPLNRDCRSGQDAVLTCNYNLCFEQKEKNIFFSSENYLFHSRWLHIA